MFSFQNDVKIQQKGFFIFSVIHLAVYEIILYIKKHLYNYFQLLLYSVQDLLYHVEVNFVLSSPLCPIYASLFIPTIFRLVTLFIRLIEGQLTKSFCKNKGNVISALDSHIHNHIIKELVFSAQILILLLEHKYPTSLILVYFEIMGERFS